MFRHPSSISHKDNLVETYAFQDYKIAVVIPLIKKASLAGDHLLDSKLSFISKLP